MAKKIELTQEQTFINWWIFICMKEVIKKLLREGLLNENFLNTPFKGKNILYHSTFIDNLINILTTNEIQANTQQTIKTSLNKDTNNQYNGVSFTRDHSYDYNEFKLIFDGDLIKRDYGKNIVPHDWARNTSSYDIGPKSAPSRKSAPTENSESEEFLVGPLKNVKKYLLGIQLLKPTDSTMEWFRDDEPELFKSFNDVTTNIPFYDMNFKQLK
tara:strand:+ start:149 stop:790 length:642 start_codon:yes stop_codon:yes gene_type:complete